jgi:hypothetical protein
VNLVISALRLQYFYVLMVKFFQIAFLVGLLF